MLEHRLFRTAYAAIVLFTLLAGDAWRYTIGWSGWAALVLILAAVAVTMLVRNRSRWAFGRLPHPLIAFTLVTVVSIVWSYYPGATALGTFSTLLTATSGIGVAVSYSWAELLSALGAAVRAILGLSILFELYVSLIVRGPILPLVPEPGIDYATLGKVPPMLYWSRDELFSVFHGGKIQGIVGNSVLLAFIALMGLVVFALQFRTPPWRRSLPWLLLSVITLFLSRSATIIAAVVVVSVVAAAVLLVRRAHSARARGVTYAFILAAVVAGATLAFAFQRPLLTILGKSEDLTGRLDIWATVIGLAQQRPVLGWGWVSYWAPWVAPFDNLIFRNGVRQLNAHDAWIDVWFQLGVVGLVVFAALVLTTLARSWSFAVVRPQSSASGPSPYTAESLLPLLVLTGLLVQSFAESRLLVEFGMFFLVVMAVKTKIGDFPATRKLESSSAMPSLR